MQSAESRETHTRHVAPRPSVRLPQRMRSSSPSAAVHFHLREASELQLETVTLHPTPYTLHPTPYTLHPTPYTLHPTP